MGSEAEVVYGFCPRCGAKGVNRERRPNGFDTCENGHHYLSSTAKDKPKPEAKCDSGLTCGGPLKCQPCAARVAQKHAKPKPDDAEEVAAWLDQHALTFHGVTPARKMIRKAAAIIRADRAKHADLAGKVRELCEEATNDCHPRTLGHIAREVLAMMEAK